MEPNWAVPAVGCLFLFAGLVHVLIAERRRAKREGTGWKFFRPVSWNSNPRAAGLRASGYVAVLIGGGVLLVALVWPEILS